MLIAHACAPSLLDVRTDIAAYLRSHPPGAQYLNTETLRAAEGGVPNLLLPLSSYATLFARLGVRADRPVVVYASGEARNIDATYVAWILSGLGHPAVRVLDGGVAQWELEGPRITGPMSGREMRISKKKQAPTVNTSAITSASSRRKPRF